MTDYGLVSIITPSYNSSQFIAETIQSIQAQSYKNWELIITDDCSTDNSCEIIESFIKKDSRIKLIKLDKNSGAGVARNTSIGASSGRYIAFCDSDDRWFPEKLQSQLNFMNAKKCDLSYSSYLLCNETDHIDGIVVGPKHVSLTSMMKDDKMGFLTVMYDVKKLGKIYLPKMRKRQDWAWKLMALKVCKVAYGMKEPLAIYRVRHDSISRNKKTLIKYNIAVYQEIFNWSYLKSLLFFLFCFLPSYFKKRLFLKWLNQ
ncbi:MAG: glycosyltransferase family 2 protein [Muribaculaceae bacterium]|nr:glycosyltransferase family 2 protein [Muribaculaceae bacterium]